MIMGLGRVGSGDFKGSLLCGCVCEVRIVSLYAVSLT